jgi:MFS transporter, putative metabolite:H+ symporter
MRDMNAAAAIAARLDRLPASRPLWGYVARISFGAFFEIYETALTTVLSPLLVRAGVFHRDSSGLFGLPDLATFGFATFVGLFLGSLVFSEVTDRIGRRFVYTYSLIWYALASLIMALQDSAMSICLWRLVAAMGVGAQIVAVDAYLSEMVPKALRGRAFAISKALQYCAVPVAGLLGAALAKHGVGGLTGWRVMLIIPCIGAILVWWVRRNLPESPRWLAAHGRVVEAAQILDDLEARVRVFTRGALPPCEPTQLLPNTIAPGGYIDLFRGQLLARTLMLLVVSCAITFAVYGFGNWLPSLLEARGVGVTKSLAYTAMIGVVYPLTPFIVSFVADRYERKWQIAAGAGLVAVAGLLFAAQTAALGWVTCGLLVTVGNNITGYAIHTYRSELFPTNVRARGIGFVYSVDRLAAAFNSFLVALILIETGATGVLLFIAAVSVVAIVIVTLFGPRTRHMSPDSVAVQVSGGSGASA